MVRTVVAIFATWCCRDQHLIDSRATRRPTGSWTAARERGRGTGIVQSSSMGTKRAPDGDWYFSYRRNMRLKARDAREPEDNGGAVSDGEGR